MACPENSTLGLCDILSEVGTGIGEFSNGAIANGGLTKFLILLGLVAGVATLFTAITGVIGNAIKGQTRRS